MAEKKEKSEKTEGEAPKKKGPLLWVLLAVGLGVGGTVAGIFLAPKLMQKPPEAAASAEEGAGEETPQEPHDAEKAGTPEVPPITVQWPPLVVDVRDEGGNSRHVKLVITIEVKDEHAKTEVLAYSPRGRQALLAHVRSQSFEDLTDSTKYGAFQTKVTELVKEQVGKKRILNVWITDLVSQ